MASNVVEMDSFLVHPLFMGESAGRWAVSSSARSFEGPTALVALLDARGSIVSVNERWTHSIPANGSQGDDVSAGVGQIYPDMCDAVVGTGEEVARHAARGIRMVLDGSTAEFSFEYAFELPNESRWFRMTASSMAVGGAGGVVVMHFDISERKRIELATQQTTELLMAVMDGTPDGIYVRDTEGRYLLCNQAAADFLGCQAEALIGKDGSASPGADLARKAFERDRGVLESETALTTEIDSLIDGQRRWIMTDRAPCRNAQGDVIGVIGISRDITQRKRTEATLEQEHRLLRTVIDSLPDIVYATDEAGRFAICNPATVAYCDARAEEDLIGRTVLDVLPGDEGAQFRADDMHVLAGNAVWDREHRNIHPREQARWYLTTKVPLLDGSDKVVGLVGISRNITQQKNSEHEARQVADRLETALQSLTDGFCTLNHNWRFTYLNSEAERMLRCRRDAVLGAVFWDHLPHLRETAAGAALEQAMAGEVSVQVIEHDALADVWFDVRAYSSAEGIAVALRDITAERAAQQQMAMLEASLSQLSEIVLITEARPLSEPGPRIVFVNEAFVGISGYAREEVLGKSPRLLQGPLSDRHELERIRAALECFEPVHAELANYRKGGEPYWVELDIVPFGVAGQPHTHFVAVQRDISERKRDRDELIELNEELDARVRVRTEELLRARDDAQQANRAKSAFLATMSHEIRTPMNGVIGMVDVLHQTSLMGYQVEMVDLIRDSAFSLLKIIDDILDFSKIEAGRLTIEHEPMRVAEVVEKVCGMLDHVAIKGGVQLTLFVDPTIPQAIVGDEIRLRQVLVNLVGNAIKFSSGREIAGQVSVRAVVASLSPSVTLDIVVADNGIGMDAETQARLFTPFSQADASITRRFGGTGLGLAISNMLVDLMGGKIGVRSAPGEGSTFTMRLQFAKADVPDRIDDAVAKVQGLHCRLVGGDVDQVLADDFSAYLTHEGAIVERFATLADAAAQPQARGICLWLILPGQGEPELPVLRAIAPSQPEAQTRFIVFGRGKRRRPRVDEFDLIRIDVDMLFRRTLFKVIAMASGLIPEEDSHQELRSEARIQVPARHEAKLQGRLILVAEDNETNRIVIQRQLQFSGFASEIVNNGREALEQWRTGDFALLLTDIHMPELDGYALASAIRAEETEGHRTPIIALTANALADEELRCRAAGMDVYLSKPIRLPLLKAVLEEWLAPVKGSKTLSQVDPASAADIPPADLRVLVALVGDDKVVIDEVLQAFRANAKQSHDELIRGIADGSSRQVSETAHKFKSAARSIGAVRLGDLCAEIEAGADSGVSEKLRQALPRFEAELSALFSYLDSR